MKYFDPIYDEIEIDEIAILEIFNSNFFQRLKDIKQGGYNYENLFFGRTLQQGNRFEHSVGCYILVKKFGAKLEERIAALIHDVSHTVFSHCVDYALSDLPEKQDFQDNAFLKYVAKTDIPNILKKYNLDLDYILNEDNFSLQENKLPDICADRLDYSLRDFIRYVGKEKKLCKYFVENLIVHNGSFVFKNKESALSFAKCFMELNKTYYSGKETAVMFFTNSNYIKYALNKSFIEYDDLFLTESFVIDKINKNLENDSVLNNLWIQMNSDMSKFVFDENNYERKIVCKSRVIDPYFIDGDSLRRVSDIDEDYKIKAEQEKNPKEYYIRYKI